MRSSKQNINKFSNKWGKAADTGINFFDSREIVIGNQTKLNFRPKEIEGTVYQGKNKYLKKKFAKINE